GILKRMSNLRLLWDIEARVRMLDEKFPDVQQVLTLSLPSPELVGGPELAPELARIANDGMAGMTAKWPKKFPAFVASLPMNNVPAALEEMDRAIAKLGARGVQICTSMNGRTADENYEDVLKRMSKKPIEYFRMFYGDTVLGGSASALRCGLDFFGADRVVFASDCPFDPEGGPMFIREGIRSVEDLKLPEADKRKIYFGNAVKLLRLPLEQKK